MKLATLCYLRKDGKTLMIHRNKKEGDMHKDKWNGLGGKLEDGETPEECAIREVKEESGLDCKNPKLKGFLTFPGSHEEVTWNVFVFVIEDFSGEMVSDTPEGTLEWIEDAKLFDLNIQEGDRIFLPWLDQEGMFSAKFVYQDKKLMDYSVNFYK